MIYTDKAQFCLCVCYNSSETILGVHQAWRDLSALLGECHEGFLRPLLKIIFYNLRFLTERNDFCSNKSKPPTNQLAK